MLCKHTGTSIENKSDKFVCEMDLEKNICYVMKSTGTLIYKSIKKIKKTEPLRSKYDDEILIKLILYG